MAALTALAIGLGTSGVGLSVTGAYGAPLWSQLEASASSSGSSVGSSSTVITYAEEVPCEPTPVAATTAPKVAHIHPRLRRKIHRRRIPQKVVPHPVVIHKPAPVVHKAVRHRVVASAHRHRRRLARVAPVAAPKRCVALHSERLNGPGLLADATPMVALDGPPAFAAVDTAPDFGLCGADIDGGGWGGGGSGGGGGEAFPNPGMGGGGGGLITGPGGSSGSVSAAPEPQTWMLMILGVGLCGAALRRNRRTAAAF
jgi:hypothetical protein